MQNLARLQNLAGFGSACYQAHIGIAAFWLGFDHNCRRLVAKVAAFVAHILPPARGGALRLQRATCLGQARRAKTNPVRGRLVTRYK